GEEKYITGMEPLTDIGYFSARVNDIGRLDTTVPRPTLIGRLKNARIHLVISAPASKTLMGLSAPLSAPFALSRVMPISGIDWPICGWIRVVLPWPLIWL
ncbi:MAG: hypothetical protein OQL17_09450, partial [Sedimenticola sp.]|nr:hypothetical protein [Sedimenticola sp.]